MNIYKKSSIISNVNRITVKQFYDIYCSNLNYGEKQIKIKDIIFSDNIISSFDFLKISFNNSVFQDIEFKDCIFNNIFFTNCLIQNCKFTNCKFEKVSFSDSSLDKILFSGGLYLNTGFYNSVCNIMEFIDFSPDNINSMYFFNSMLQEIDLSSVCRIASFVLVNTNADNCRFNSIMLNEACVLMSRFSNCNFKYCDLSSSQIEDCSFSGCNFKRAEFDLAKLKNNKFIKCNFTRTTLLNGVIDNNSFTDTVFQVY